MHIGKSAKFEQDRSYEDMEGNLRTFTIRDYSKKTKVATHNEKVDYKEAFKEYREELYYRLMDLPAALALPEYEKYISPVTYDYEWDVAMIKDEGLQIDELRRIVTHCENKQNIR